MLLQKQRIFLKLLEFYKINIKWTYIRRWNLSFHENIWKIELCSLWLKNGNLFDYFVRKPVTQTISLLKSWFPLLVKWELRLERLLFVCNWVHPHRSDALRLPRRALVAKYSIAGQPPKWPELQALLWAYYPRISYRASHSDLI